MTGSRAEIIVIFTEARLFLNMRDYMSLSKITHQEMNKPEIVPGKNPVGRICKLSFNLKLNQMTKFV